MTREEQIKRLELAKLQQAQEPTAYGWLNPSGPTGKFLTDNFAGVGGGTDYTQSAGGPFINPSQLTGSGTFDFPQTQAPPVYTPYAQAMTSPSVMQNTPFGEMVNRFGFSQGLALPSRHSYVSKAFDSSNVLGNEDAQNTAQRSKETAESLADGYKAVADAMSGSIDMGFGKMVKDSSGKTSYQPNKGGAQDLASVGFQAEPNRSYSTEKDAAGNIISISPLAQAREDPLLTAQAKGWKAPGSEGGAGSPFTPNLNKFIASQNPDVMAKTMQGQNPSDVAQKDYAMKNVQGSKMSDIGNIQAKARTPIPEIPKKLGSIQGSAPQINKPDLTSFNNKWKQAENKMMEAYRKNPALASKDFEEIKKKKNPNQPNS